MSKSLKKLIDINRLREFKNKLVGTDSAYVQTGAVDQTVDGTKTFSEPIVGSVTGNAATATKTTQDSDGNKITTTYSKNGHTHDDRYYTETEVNSLLGGKANTSHDHNYVRTPDYHSISFDWSSQDPGFVGLTVDVTKMGGIVTTATLSAYVTKSILSMVYPVGSVYISVNDVSPAAFLGGTWEKISQGRVLQGASGTQTAGTEVSAGLPNISVSQNGAHTHTRGSMNITGSVSIHGAGAGCTVIEGAAGAFYGSNIKSSYHGPNCVSGASSEGALNFSADRTWTGSTSSDGAHSHGAYITGITGNSTTVQPPALLVNIWKRTA